jgi:5'(3')-deoxyribonucleotidase
MNLKEKRKVVFDFDDTLVKSSEEIIRQINNKYNLNKTINDLTDWNYSSIYKELKETEVLDLYASQEFFDNVKLNNGAKEFIDKFHSVYKFVVCSKGTKLNLEKKERFCDKLFENYDYEFIGLEFNNEKDTKQLNKSCIDFSDCLFCLDDNVSSLTSINTPKKVLIKNYHEFPWNETPINETNIYVINSFKELEQICDFDLKLRNEGIVIG